MAVRHDDRHDVLRPELYLVERCRNFSRVLRFAAINDIPTLFLLRETAVVLYAGGLGTLDHNKRNRRSRRTNQRSGRWSCCV